MKDLCIAIQYTSYVCCFLWVPVVMQHSCMMSIVLNSISWDWKLCQQFFGSHTLGSVQFSVTLSTKDFPHHSVFKRFFFFYVSETFSEIIYHCSQHICLWCWAETLFCKHASQISSRWTCKVNLASGGIFFSGAIKNSLFPPDCWCCALLKSHECLHLKWRWSRPADYSMFLYSAFGLCLTAVEVRITPSALQRKTGLAFGLLLLLLISCSTRR